MSLPYLRKTLATLRPKEEGGESSSSRSIVSPQSKLKVIALLVIMSVISAAALAELFSPSSMPSLASLFGMDLFFAQDTGTLPEKKADASKRRVTVETSLGEETVSVTVAV